MTSFDAKAALADSLVRAAAEYSLESHPFLDRYAAGQFSPEAIRWWAIKMLPGSNRFNQAFLKVAAAIEDYRARILLLRNIYSEHGDLDPEAAHVELYMRFMRGIDCSRIDVHEDDGAFRVPELRFKRFEIQANEPIIWSLGRFAAIEFVLPGVFTRYIEGLRKIFPGISDHTIEYFHVHCELDPTHTDELLQVASLYVASADDVRTFSDGVRDMLLSLTDMFSWMDRTMAVDVDIDPFPETGDTQRPKSGLRVADRTLYSSDADLYDPIYYRDSIYRYESAFILDHLKEISRPHVLDLCAGTGSHAKLLTERGAVVVGVDSSDAMLDIARRKVAGTQFIRADIRSLALDQTFDLVMCMYGAIHYIEEPQDVVTVMRNTLGHLKPGGLLIMDLRDRENLPERQPSETTNGLATRKFWLRRRGVDDSDLYLISAYDRSSERHFLEVHNLFHTDPFRIANWARMTGFQDICLHSAYRREAHYDRSSGENRVVLVARRPGD